MLSRRELLAGSGGLLAAANASVDQPSPASSTRNDRALREWDGGQVMHLLPTVSHERILIKASFRQALGAAPLLKIGSQRRVQGRMSDTRGEFWQFDAPGLQPATE